jgi:hypothetical protein
MLLSLVQHPAGAAFNIYAQSHAAPHRPHARLHGRIPQAGRVKV